jgi:rare lipoprotein A
MASWNLRGRLAWMFFASIVTLILYTLPLQAEDVLAKSKQKRVGTDASTLQGAGSVEGIATYYAKKYNGRRTYSGEIYRPGKMTAAHPNLPMGTRVKVIDLTNGKEVVVLINDRCRQRTFQIIDLSWIAAKKLELLYKGVTQVKLVIL